MSSSHYIPIKNIFYMLTYAFKELNHNNYERIAGEEFEDIHNLFAEILYLGISCQLKQGLHKAYILHEEVLPTLKGKLNMSATSKERIVRSTKLCCEYDDFSENNIFNQILKTAIEYLLTKKEVKKERRNKLRSLLLFFKGIDKVPAKHIRWNTLRYDQSTRTYHMLHSLCMFLFDSLLLSTQKGNVKAPLFSDSHMNMLFQRFVLEYYKRHHPNCKATAQQIQWDITANDATAIDMLPTMQTDITLTVKDRTLIIDTKYYGQNTQTHFDKQTILSGNLYQIHTYVMNAEQYHATKGKVDGMLLYAQTQNSIQPYLHFQNSQGNRFMVRTLDLNQKFDKIKESLDLFLEYY